MIVRDRPGALRLMLAWKGSVVPHILPHILLAGLFAAVVTWVSRHHYLDGIVEYTLLPFTLMGIALSILLSVRNTATYNRWWEARRQWGRMVYEMRSLARAGGIHLDAARRRELMMRALGHAHLLRGQLRGEDVRADLPASLSTVLIDQALATRNPAALMLQRAGDVVAEARREGEIDSVAAAALDQHLHGMAGIQAASERIAQTPLPFAYTLLAHRTAYVYCYLLPFGLVAGAGWFTPVFTAIVAYTFFGLDRLSEQLEFPFGREANDLPLDAICRVHEISVAEALGDPAPEPLRPVAFELQ
ncbi:Bestrophin, RFP-TM, chloride channel [Halomonas sp. THAF5a]|uniref:bestrophin family protein n=1 Tax=Halomonas sp. THAF5a TaxID=2587844 RepID=UPI00126866CA|nr:bestrophin family ion channel [Halomonas sp. THAF5a]QFU02015.1 Bestrophin, RFP-TM, chloride channel [Halomonas sp. THAF5a]